MKKIIITILTIFLSEFSLANFYKKGDTLNVWAISGLNLREGPGTNFSKIKKLDYGDRVEVVDQNLQLTPHNLTVIKKTKENDALVLEGFWVRVKIGNQEGYVFDGYLSRLSVLKIKKVEKNRLEVERYFFYASREFGTSTCQKDTIRFGTIHNHCIYKNGFETHTYQFECYGASFELHDLSFSESYLLFDRLSNFEYDINHLTEKEKTHSLTNFKIENLKNGKFSLEYSYEGGGLSLIWEDGKFIIKESICC